MDDVTYGRSGPNGVTWPARFATSRQLRARPGQSLMSMNVCCNMLLGYYINLFYSVHQFVIHL